MTAPTRVLHTAGRAYAVDPYVRDSGGRFAEHPTEPLPPLQVLESAATAVEVLYDGRVAVAPDTSSTWRVRTIREEDGTFRILYLEHGA